MSSFDEWFKRATESYPFPYQKRFAEEGEIPQLVDVPTGLGKTAMAVLGWLWRRKFADDLTRQLTPRRLVYCLPMRVLVEQTRDNAVLWLRNLELFDDAAEFGPDKVRVHVLMGGEDEEDWDIYPEREQIIIGTQDMLLSRALNRGYAATRSRWPIQFGLLNTNCLWVFDEIQLMGAGLATTTQLEAFRRILPDKDREIAKNSHGCRSVWMSATMRRDWLKSVDFASFLDGVPDLAFDFEREINSGGLDQKAREALEDRWNAKKPLSKAEAAIGDAAGLAQEVRNAHKPGTRSIVLVNTVKRACAVFEALNTVADGDPNISEPRIVLLHSRFRPEDRKNQVDRALAEIKPGEPGTIVVSTQVIEAGVDLSATILFTELAPWASLVQRFGRCNRRGEDNDNAAVHWVAMPAKDTDAEKVAAPYELEDLKAAAKQLEKLTDVGLKSLPDVPLCFEHGHVIRRKDLIDLFDTTPDLAGNDIDIDRFVRDVVDSDARVFWRSWKQPKGYEPPVEDEPAPQREELCPAPIGTDKNPGFRQFAKKHAGKVWRWSFLDKKWERADAGKIAPGQVCLVHANAGGYSAEWGWDPLSNSRVDPIVPPEGTKRDAPDSTEGEPLSRIGIWQTISEHVNEVREELDEILRLLHLTSDEAEALRHAVRWHDRGKAHEIFQRALPDDVSDTKKLWAKAPKKGWKRYERRHFRHELASALSVLDPRNDKIPNECRDLVAYLVAAHHGKVRLSIRSLPNEFRPHGDRRFARGVWDDDELPATDLGGGVTAPAVMLSLEPMELGLCEQEPFRGRPSWAERMIRLRDTFGPFRLAYIEAILRAADMRASREAEQREADKLNLDVVDGRREAVRD
jgi:CRISPR-associated endonuclease/helicase Cas3